MHTLHMRSYIMHKSIRNITPFETCEYQKRWLEHADLFLPNALFVHPKFINSPSLQLPVTDHDTVHGPKADPCVACMNLH